MKRFEQWQDMIARLYPELGNSDESNSSIRTLSRTVTFQVTDKCNLACTYCYQINKSTRVMKFEYAKKLIDMLLEGDEKLGGYVDIKTSPGIILEFIGGEPFLQVELIEKMLGKGKSAEDIADLCDLELEEVQQVAEGMILSR